MFITQTRNTYLIPAILFLLWLLVQALLFIKFGAQTSVDSTVYIDDANQILSGNLPEGRSVWYLGYSLFLALVFLLKGTITTVVFIQIILSGVAALGLYVIAQEIYRDQYIALLAVLLYLLWIKIHQWNTFVYTESLFTTFTILSFAALIKSRERWKYGLALLMIVFTFFIRPTGFAFVSGLAWLIIMSLTICLSRRVILFMGVGGLLAATLLLNKMLLDYTLIDSYVKAELIYPDINLGLTPAHDVWLPDESSSPLVQLVQFIIHNPLYSLKLFFLKLILFLGNVKPYFSYLHNILIVCTLYPLYFFAVKGYINFPPERKEKHFIVAYVLVQSLTVAFTTENWDGRFLIPLLPFIFILSAAGIRNVFSKRL